ncbi:hypothetical protein GW17_00027122 [Ensete ventricosum]|nr:hypothetical protein GW17_00027122 [Ensete ventricosum]
MESEESVSRSGMLRADALGMDVECLTASPDGARSDFTESWVDCQWVTSLGADLLSATLPLLGLGEPLGAMSSAAERVAKCAPVPPWGVRRQVLVFKQREWKQGLRGSPQDWLRCGRDIFPKVVGC